LVLTHQHSAVTISNIFHPVVQSNPAQSTSILTSSPAQPSTPVQVSSVTQTKSSRFSTVTESRTVFDQTPLADLNFSFSCPTENAKTSTNIVSATQTAPTVLPIETSGHVSQPEIPSTTLVDLTNFEISTIPATAISAAQVFTPALPNSSNNDLRKRYSANCSVSGEGTSGSGQTTGKGEAIQWFQFTSSIPRLF